MYSIHGMDDWHSRWRTRAGDDIAFVVEWKDQLLPIEVRATASPHPDDCRGLRVFLAEHGRRCPAGLLLHTGNDLRWMANVVLAAPWWRLM